MCPIVRGHVKHAHLPSGDRDHMEGDLLDWMNLKGALGDVPICDDTSSNRSWVVSSALPSWNDGVREVSLCAPMSTCFHSILSFTHFVDRSSIHI